MCCTHKPLCVSSWLCGGHDLIANLFCFYRVAHAVRQRDGEDIFNARCVVNGDSLGLVRGQVFLDVWFHVNGQNDIADSGTLGGEELFLDATYR